jgi:hypothetical protein
MRLSTILFATAFAIAAGATAGCTKSQFTGGNDDRPKLEGKDGKKAGRSPNEQDSTCKEGTPGCIPGDKRTNLNIRIVRLNSESWWKNCVNVAVLVDGVPTQQGTISLGCNKDTSVGAEKVLIGHKEKCNVIRVTLRTFENQGDTCNKNPTAPCNGPYGTAPSREKSSEKAEDRRFFEVFDARSLSLVFGVPSFSKLVNPSDLALKESVTGTSELNGWLRLFLEDQPEANLSQWMTQTDTSEANRKKIGIDYDDYVFDIQSRGGAKIAVEGDNLFFEPRPASFVTPPGCAK